MIKKKHCLIIIVLIIYFAFFIAIPNVMAEENAVFDVTVADAPPTSGNPSNPGTPSGNGTGNSCETATVAGYRGYCGISLSTSFTSTVYMNLYDDKGRFIGTPVSDSFKSYQAKAGTFIGIDIYEEYKKTVTATINPGCYNVVLTCTKTIEGEYYQCCKEPNKKSWDIDKKEYKCLPNGYETCVYPSHTEDYTRYSGSCDSGDSSKGSCNYSCTPPTVESCYAEAEEMLAASIGGVNPSYVAKRRDVNNINKEGFKTIEAYTINDDSGPIRNGNQVSRTVTKYFKYNPQQACMGTKTGKVGYVDFGESCDKLKNELGDDAIMPIAPIKNGNNQPIGQYFIPLNTKSGNNMFSYHLEPNGAQRHSGKLCLEVINKYRADGRWRQVLYGLDRKPLPDGISDKRAEELVANGCYYGTIININVIQQFYNEESKKIKGYGMYFRPIDVNNPFPNGLTNYSIWKNYYDTKEKKVENLVNAKDQKLNIIESYDKIYYRIELTNSKIKSIKDFNISSDTDEIYTSWKAMNKDGTSKFVKSYIDNKNVSDDSFYKLGCGPLNKNWTECGRS